MIPPPDCLEHTLSMTATTSPQAKRTTLPVWPLVIEAHRIFFDNIAALVRTGLAWIGIVVVAVGALYWFMWPAELASWNRPNAESQILIFLTLAVTSLAGSSLAVAWHRFILLDEPLPGLGYLRLDGIVQTYFAVATIFMLWFVLPILLLTRDPGYYGPLLFDTAFALAALVAATVMITRLVVLLPAVSIDRTDATMETAWDWSSGCLLRLLTGTILTSIVPFALLAAVVLADPAFLAGPPENRLSFVIVSCVYEVVGLLAGMLTSGFYALAYRELAGKTRAPADSPST